MRFAVIKCINGSFSVDSEFTDINKALVKFHDVCKNLWNASDVLDATVKVVDNTFAEYHTEYITHEAPQPQTKEVAE